MPNISITGAAVEGEADTYWLNLYDADSKWTAGEPGSTSKVFKTKSGKWLYKPIPDKGVYGNDASSHVAFFLRNLDPSVAKVGDSGQGQEYETARLISWRINSL